VLLQVPRATEGEDLETGGERRACAFELLDKGVRESVLRRAEEGEPSWNASARTFGLRKKKKQWTGLPHLRRKGRMTAFLWELHRHRRAQRGEVAAFRTSFWKGEEDYGEKRGASVPSH